MKLLIVSLGSIGRRHLRNVRRLMPSAQVAVWRRPESAPVPELALAHEVFTDHVRALGWGADAALVCGPASEHVPVARSLAERGAHLFVEKPLSHDLQEADALLALCRQRGVILMVGYNLRFCEPLKLLEETLRRGSIGRPLVAHAIAGQALPDWRPGADYRRSVSARAKLGGGVLLELSHELDYLCWLLGDVDAVGAVTGRVGDLDIDVEDAAALTLRFASGALGTLLLDMVRRPAARRCQIAGTQGTAEWDAESRTVRIALAGERDVVHTFSDEALRASYEAELAHFVECVRERRPPGVTGEDGRRALAVALAAREAASHGPGRAP